ncbi:hypothetical protein [Tenacibaculum aiptasiae]|uniref:phosphorylase family protein n=1 Tax=Tenacibaculum aiptasiae TaxID=426481 RepID=UPI003B5CDBEE
MRINKPKGYVDWLKTTPIFKKGELDNLPEYCIIIHDSLILEHLTLLGYSLRNYRIYIIGATDPIHFYLVREVNTEFEFILMNGLPGAGGICTQVGELSALGCKKFFHIGTCGLFNENLSAGKIILSKGSLKDQAAHLLSENNDSISKPNSNFRNDFKDFLLNQEIKFQEGLGVTIPIFYNQPSNFLIPLIKEKTYHFIEMEQAAFFESCKVNGVIGLSLVTGSDRYTLKNENLKHEYYDLDQNLIKNKILKTCINYFKFINK